MIDSSYVLAGGFTGFVVGLTGAVTVVTERPNIVNVVAVAITIIARAFT